MKLNRYVQKFLEIESLFEDIIFIDESGFSLAMRRSKGWSQRGLRANIRTRHVRSKNITLIAAMSSQKLYKFKIFENSTNSQIFYDYMVQLISDILLKGIKNVLFVMDNAPVHNKTNLIDLANSEGHQILFLPPYSPFLNPIENVFHQWKSIVRKNNPKSHQELVKLMEEAPNEISSTQLNSYVRHSKKYFLKCLNKEPILD